MLRLGRDDVEDCASVGVKWRVWDDVEDANSNGPVWGGEMVGFLR